MAYGQLTRVRHSAVVSTGITILQLKAGATMPFELLKCWLNQRGSSTSVQENIQLIRKSAAATGTIAVAGTHVFKLQGASAPTSSLELSTTATMVIASSEGTDGDIVDDQGFNVLTGYEWVRLHEGHIIVPAAGFIALKFATAPASQTWKFGMDIKELG